MATLPPLTSISIPTTLKLAQLKSLAFKCGVSTTGSKPILTSRIQNALLPLPPQAASTKARTVRVLSIDMGIRNLAYCVLDVPTSISRTASLEGNIPVKKPSLIAWQRLAVSTAPTPSLPTPSITSPENTAIKKPSKPKKPSQPKEAFDPLTLSQTAYHLLTSLLLPTSPTHILIERQRFRSMGSKHILEWTIRVNMFESILHAVLCTLKMEGRWKGEVKVVVPGKVGPFWLGEDAVEMEAGHMGGDDDDSGGRMVKKRTSQSVKVRNKGRKMDLVRGWLESGEMVELGNGDVEGVAKKYMEKWDRLPGGRRKKVIGEDEREERMGKLDDLADCLLQGLAWVQWEENKELARQEGVEALLQT